jgi:hypothetical protein
MGILFCQMRQCGRNALIIVWCNDNMEFRRTYTYDVSENVSTYAQHIVSVQLRIVMESCVLESVEICVGQAILCEYDAQMLEIGNKWLNKDKSDHYELLWGGHVLPLRTYTTATVAVTMSCTEDVPPKEAIEIIVQTDDYIPRQVNTVIQAESIPLRCLEKTSARAIAIIAVASSPETPVSQLGRLGAAMVPLQNTPGQYIYYIVDTNPLLATEQYRQKMQSQTVPVNVDEKQWTFYEVVWNEILYRDGVIIRRYLP